MVVYYNNKGYGLLTLLGSIAIHLFGISKKASNSASQILCWRYFGSLR